jgi:tripartite-type tricarboxylate transporter receptor subunit TctC
MLRGRKLSLVTTCCLAICLVIGTLIPVASNETYPSRPVKIVVPYGAGGIADVTMRLAAQKMSNSLGKQFVIENRPGAGGAVALKAVASSAPDGHTLTMIGGGLTIAKALFKSLPYDLEADFTPISTTAFYGLLVAVRGDSPLKSVKDILEAAKANPGKLNFGSINVGSTQHMSAELFRALAKIDVAIVPYKTSPELLTALLRGDIDVGFEYDAALSSALQDRRIVPVAFTGQQRAAHLPDVPTINESGLADYEAVSWNGLAAPVRTPAHIIATLNKAVVQAVSEADVRAATAKFGMESRGSSVEELQTRIKSDVAKWADVIAKARIEKQ